MRCSAHSLFDLYHYLDDFEATRQLIVFDPSFDQVTQRGEYNPRGLVIAGLHLSGFDLVLQWLVRGGLDLLVLTISDPRGGRRIEYETRKRTGMNVMPASFSSIRHALKHLQKGGTVLTGIDRPLEGPEVTPRFFGRPAALPVHHIFLAVKARVPVILSVAYLRPDGKYHVFASDPIEMDSAATSPDILIRNAENVLGVAEKFIRRAPHQWSVPLPVWPQLMNTVPP
jgi:KDO2-lipid IV(A) lauroyltransferase